MLVRKLIKSSKMTEKLDNPEEKKGLCSKLDNAINNLCTSFDEKSKKVVFGGVSWFPDKFIDHDFFPFLGVMRYSKRYLVEGKKEFKKEFEGTIEKSLGIRALNRLKLMSSYVYLGGLFYLNYAYFVGFSNIVSALSNPEFYSNGKMLVDSILHH